MRLQNEYATSRMCELVQLTVAQGGEIVGVSPDELATPTMVGALYRF
jgi:hypothetical protein